MATTKSTLFAKFDTVGGKKRPDSTEAEGRVRYLNDTIVFEGDEAADAKISVLPLPVGCMIDLARSSFIGASLSGVSVDLGVNGEADNLADGVSLATAGTKALDASGGLVEVTEGGVTLTLKAGSPADGATVRASICYYVR